MMQNQDSAEDETLLQKGKNAQNSEPVETENET